MSAKCRLLYIFVKKVASIKFLLQSVSNPASIYIRLLDGRKVDIKTKTNLVINPEDWSHAKQRPKSLKNEAFKTLDSQLQNLRTNLLNFYNNSHDEIINLNWLKSFINPQIKSNIPLDLVSYFDYYIKERGEELNPRTVLKIKVVQNKLLVIQKLKRKTYLLKDVNIAFKNEFEKYNIDNNYSANTILSNLKEIKTICLHARKRGLVINPEIEDIKTTQKKAVSIFLSFEDMVKIEVLNLNIKNLQDARDWLLISCYTAQRVSDFMRFTSSMIREENSVKLIEFTQKKTGKIMTLPLHPKVIEILNKRDFQFPDKQLDKDYNIHIKSVCKKAEINNIVFGGKMINKRKAMGNYPKHELVTSHIGRRSFATNFYGKIPTALLMGATGHFTEAMFLIYIGKSNSDKALELSNYF